MSGVAELKAALDPVRFAESVGVVPDLWQAEFLRSTSDRLLLNCSRQSGKSTLSSIMALHRALYHPESLVLLLAPALRQSQELFAKLFGFYSDLGEPLKKFGERRLSLELSNGSRIVTLPGSEKTIRGYSGVSLLILDEAARIEDPLYYSVRPMLAVSGGRIALLSTPFGKRGVFYDEWMEGSGWHKFEVPATECPRISAAFLQEERESLGDWWYEQEYMCKFKENVDSVFSSALIEEAMSDDVEPLFAEGER
ncbi:MAG: terminase [Actinobacteria bacterium]|nr:terminase [Actinomycetota bacterium]